MANETVSVSAKYVLSLYYEYRVMFSKVLFERSEKWKKMAHLQQCENMGPQLMHLASEHASSHRPKPNYVITRHLRICHGPDARQQHYYLYYDPRTNSGGIIYSRSEMLRT